MPLTPGLPSLLAGLRPALLPGEWVWVAGTPAGIPAPFTFTEPEGRSSIVARSDADRCGLAYDFVAAWIVLRVVSPLAAVGLTAAVSGALAERGIPCNVIAALRHDHCFVPIGCAGEALAALEALGRP